MMMMIEIFANEIKSTIESFPFLPLANKVWDKVILLHLSVHGGMISLSVSGPMFLTGVSP